MMSFIADKQSLEDLNLLGKYKSNSIFSLFNKTKTIGGEKLLEAVFKNPLTDDKKINERSAIFQYFEKKNLSFPYTREVVEFAEQYLNEASPPNLAVSILNTLQKKLSQLIFRSDDYKQLQMGIQAMRHLLKDFSLFLNQFQEEEDHPFKSSIQEIKSLLQHPQLASLVKGYVSLEKFNVESNNPEPSVLITIRLHFLFKNTFRDSLKRLMKILYELDMYIAVSDVARIKELGYAKALPVSENKLKAAGLRHPALIKAVANSVCLNQYENVLFLTGANMAGKSTWMKTIGVAVYLAHLGIPLAADSFEFSVLEGIYSSINVPDDLNLGYSHFYAEVLRVKEVAQKVSEGKNLLILFDELFKGTNVKDAYDATLAVSEAFANYTNCLYVISTHIIEVGEALGERCQNIQFRYLPTVLEGTVPGYTYQLTEGITSDRQGMMIIENERILEIINQVELSSVPQKKIVDEISGG